MDERRLEELVRRTLAGETRAFEGIVEEFESVLFNVALRMTNDREDARDAVQTAFLKAYRRLDTWDSRHRFFSWIYRILLNATFDVLARRRPREELDDDIPDAGPSPEQRLLESEQSGLVRAAVMQLSPEKREVIVLRHFAELSYLEMSETLGIPEATVKSRLFEARRTLAAILKRRGVRA